MRTESKPNIRWTWSAATKRALEVFQEGGVKSLWFKILGETIYRRVVLLERRLDEPIAEMSARLPVVVGLLRETDIDAYMSFRHDIDPVEIRRRLDAGQWAFVARHAERIVHAGWAVAERAWIEYLDCEIRLAQDEVYTYDSFTMPSWRGKNIAAVRITAALHYFRDAGYRRLLGVVMPENMPAFRPLEKAGYRPCGVMGYIRIGWWRRHFCRMQRGSLPPGELARHAPLSKRAKSGQ